MKDFEEFFKERRKLIKQELCNIFDVQFVEGKQEETVDE